MVCAALAVSGATSFPECPAVGSDTSGCELLITVTAVDGTGAATAFSVAASVPDLGPFDASDDTLIGILNSSGSTLNSIFLSGGAVDIFGFDGDGACSGLYGTIPGCSTATDPSGYAPGGVTFSGINTLMTSGTVNFSPGVPNTGSQWFSMEEALTVTSFSSGTPEPATFGLIGLGLTGLYFVRRRAKA